MLCDASTRGVGGALCVFREDVWMPAAFCSRQLQLRETRYTITELEALTMLTSIKKFANYLVGRQFKVLTDHKALVSFFTSSQLNNRLWRWRLQLADYDFSIEYVQGKDHCIPDSLRQDKDGLMKKTTISHLRRGNMW